MNLVDSDISPAPEPKSTSIEKALNLMSSEGFWEAFFDHFIQIVHPAEFSIVVKNGSACQREVALSAVFYRVFQTINPVIGIQGWTPVLEAPVIRMDGGIAYCDITLFPWDRNSQQDSWIATKDPDRHIRVEVKWLDMGRGGSGDAQAIYNLASKNHSRQHFTASLIFHGENNKPPLPENGRWPLNDRWEKVSVLRQKRVGADFPSDYSDFTLVVLKDKNQLTTEILG